MLLSVNSILDRCVCPCVCVRVSKPPVFLTNPALQLRKVLHRSHANELVCLCVMIFKKVKALDDIHSPPCVAPSLHISPPPDFPLVFLSGIFFFF